MHRYHPPHNPQAGRLIRCLATAVVVFALSGLLPSVGLAQVVSVPAPGGRQAPAPNHAAGDASLGLENAIAEYTVHPGETLTHHMVVSLGPVAPEPLDVRVDARGLGQGPDGATIALAPEADVLAISARTFITDIDHPSFKLQPGQSVPLNATIAIPEDLKEGTRYADVYVHTLPSANGKVGVILAEHVPVLLTVAGSKAVETGSITRIDVKPPVSGHPIGIVTTFQNTGNHHFKADDRVILTDRSGTQVAQMTVPQRGSSILPGYEREYHASFSLLDKLSGLQPGTYSAISSMVTPDGQVLDTRRVDFQLTAAYQPFPDIDPDSLTIVTYNDEVPGPIDARAKADLQVSFSDVGKVTGTVVLGRFKSEPKTMPRAADSTNDGGLGKPGLKYWGIGVQGFSAGLAHVTMYYRDPELAGAPANTLFVGDLPSSAPRWIRIDSQEVFPNAQNARGDLGIVILNNNPIIALASEPPVAIAGVQQQGSITDVLRANWLLVLAAALALSIGPSLVLVMTRRRRN